MNAPSTAELMLRMILSLAIMGGLLWGVLRFGKGRRGRSILAAVGGSTSGTGRARVDPIEVCARRSLSRSSSLTLVRVGQRTLLLGVGEAGVQVLAEGDGLSVVDQPPTPVAVGSDGFDASDTVMGRAGTHARASRPDPARMGVVDALRELTVRR